MLYVMDFSFGDWNDLVRRSRPIADADMCYICEGALPGCIASVRGDGLVIYYSDRNVLRLAMDQHWLAKLTLVDPEDRFHVVLQSAQMDAFRMVMDRLCQIYGESGLEHLWDIPLAIELLERCDSNLARYLRDSHPFPFVRDADTSIWPFLKREGGNMQCVHIYGNRSL